MKILALAEQFAKSNELEKTIRESLKGMGYEFYQMGKNNLGCNIYS